MTDNIVSIQKWHEDEEIWWNLYGEYMTYQWKLTPELSDSIRGDLERDYKDFLLAPGAQLLDLGCGSGWLSAYFAERGMSVTGIDISHEQIRAANDLKTSLNLNSVEFQCIDFINWDESKYQGRFSSVFVSAFLHHLPESELESTMAKIARILKPGGLLYLYEPLQCDNEQTLAVKVVDKILNITTHLLLNKIPNWFGWWNGRHLAELERGYQMNSPHERPVPLEMLKNYCSQNFDILGTKGWHLNSLGMAMQSMGMAGGAKSVSLAGSLVLSI